MRSLNHAVFWPPFLIIVAVIFFGLLLGEGFIQRIKAVQEFILMHFDWLFDWVTLAFLVTLLCIYASPFGAKVIGGKCALPILKKREWFVILLCTTVATGILFWGPAEPLYHMGDSPFKSSISANSQSEALSIVFMHWSFSPYAIYTALSLSFALGYYNFGGNFSIYTLIGISQIARWPVLNYIIHSICIFSLVAGMAAALGTGTLMIASGISQSWKIPTGPVLWSIIILAIVAMFTISSVLGLHRGIKRLSYINFVLFVVLGIIFLTQFPVGYLSDLSFNAFKSLILRFIDLSVGATDIDSAWRHEWTSFYWSNWYAWAPLTALFLGRLGRGYSVRTFIRFNLVYTSLFSLLWMSIFSGSSLYVAKMQGEEAAYTSLQINGSESVIYNMLSQLPSSEWMIALFLFTVLISYSTAADSNTTSLSQISAESSIDSLSQTSSSIKILWGLLIGILSGIMIIYTGVDGVRILSVIGGFPVVIMVALVPFSLVWKLFRDHND